MVAADRLPAGLWVADPAGSSVAFAVAGEDGRPLRGRFTAYEARLAVAPGGAATLTGTARPGSIAVDGGVPAPATLASPALFDSARHPEIRFEASEIRRDGDLLDFAGGLTVKGATLCVAGVGSVAGPRSGPSDGGAWLGLELETCLDRRQFGLAWAPSLGYEVKLEVALRLCYRGDYTP